jgi:flagellin
VASQSKDGFLKLTAADGRNINLSFADGANTPALIDDFADKLGFTGATDAAVTQAASSSLEFTYGPGTITDINIGTETLSGAFDSHTDIATAINANANLQALGVSAAVQGGNLVVTGLLAADVDINTIAQVNTTSGGAGTFTDVTSRNITAIADITLQSEENFTVTGGAAIGFATDGVFGTNSTNSVKNVNIGSREGAIKALDIVDLAIEHVSASRAALGALQNRLESTINNLTTTSENLSASRSRIMDADFAQETAALSRNQIIQQAGVSILAQANQQPQIALALFG